LFCSENNKKNQGAKIIKFMFIILSIHSKNLNSLTNFLKFFYKLKTNKTLKLRFYSIQSQLKDKFSFFSTLQSPHVNKKSQEQFEYSLYNKKLKIHASQMIKFLTTWKIVKTIMFSDVKIEIKFWVPNDLLKNTQLTKLNCDKFKSKPLKRKPTFYSKRVSRNHMKYITGLRRLMLLKLQSQRKGAVIFTNTTAHTFLTLLDIHGEILIKSFQKLG